MTLDSEDLKAIRKVIREELKIAGAVLEDSDLITPEREYQIRKMAREDMAELRLKKMRKNAEEEMKPTNAEKIAELPLEERMRLSKAVASQFRKRKSPSKTV